MKTTRLRTKIRAKVVLKANRPRLTVFRSNNHIYAQIIDDTNGKTLASSQTLKSSLGLLAQAKEVGEAIATAAKAAKITQVVFDRNRYPYKGAVKVLAESARQGGLSF
jgi:large subunit ribosomal protein L18